MVSKFQDIYLQRRSNRNTPNQNLSIRSWFIKKWRETGSMTHWQPSKYVWKGANSCPYQYCYGGYKWNDNDIYITKKQQGKFNYQCNIYNSCINFNANVWAHVYVLLLDLSIFYLMDSKCIYMCRSSLYNIHENIQLINYKKPCLQIKI